MLLHYKTTSHMNSSKRSLLATNIIIFYRILLIFHQIIPKTEKNHRFLYQSSCSVGISFDFFLYFCTFRLWSLVYFHCSPYATFGLVLKSSTQKMFKVPLNLKIWFLNSYFLDGRLYRYSITQYKSHTISSWWFEPIIVQYYIYLGRRLFSPIN